MAEFLLELLSEDIPSRMQAGAEKDLSRLFQDISKPLNPKNIETFSTPRRIGLIADVQRKTSSHQIRERGPRITSGDKAIEGFLRKHHAARQELTEDADFLVLTRMSPEQTASNYLASVLPNLLWNFPWPKSQRWGNGSALTWVRPLRRIVCLIDGSIIPFSLAKNGDHAHNLSSGDLSEGHRFMAPQPFQVRSTQQWREELQKRFVMIDAARRQQQILVQLRELAAEKHVCLVEDKGLTKEVSGLVEWPHALLGKIDANFMDLPPEVMHVSMRVNQRYFVLNYPDGQPSPFFGLIANICPSSSHLKQLITSGNEQVLRARFADARYFWNHDRTTSLAKRIPALDRIIFHAQLGTQGERVSRLQRLARHCAQLIGADSDAAERAAFLSKADLTTGMVAEFPELQGIMGGYYARHDGETNEVANAIRDQYLPKGPADHLPSGPVGTALALADKIDILSGFFAANERPRGSGDPYGLRRAALGIIRLIREKNLRLDIDALFSHAAQLLPKSLTNSHSLKLLSEFMLERLKIQLKHEGIEYDRLASVLAVDKSSDYVRIIAKAQALTSLLQTEKGRAVLIASKRASNILRIEEKQQGIFSPPPLPHLFCQEEERALYAILLKLQPRLQKNIETERYVDAITELAELREPLDGFFERVVVNDPSSTLRENRLKLLSLLRQLTTTIVDFRLIKM